MAAPETGEAHPIPSVCSQPPSSEVASKPSAGVRDNPLLICEFTSHARHKCSSPVRSSKTLLSFCCSGVEGQSLASRGSYGQGRDSSSSTCSSTHGLIATQMAHSWRTSAQRLRVVPAKDLCVLAKIVELDFNHDVARVSVDIA